MPRPKKPHSGSVTKRVRTICNDRQAKLINWYKRGNDWHGVMATQTVESMRIALDERAEALEGRP